MVDRQIEHYHSRGYEEFLTEVLPSIKCTLDKTLGDEEERFGIAILKAVQNAAMHARDGADKARLDIDLVTTDTDISVTVRADTEKVDVLEYRRKLGRMARDEKIGEMDWRDFVRSSCSRCYFTMLMAVECLYVDVTGKSITLCVARPYRLESISRKIKDMVPRFMLEKNGVILEGDLAN